MEEGEEGPDENRAFSVKIRRSRKYKVNPDTGDAAVVPEERRATTTAENESSHSQAASNNNGKAKENDDDGIRRVTWDQFLRLVEPPTKKKKRRRSSINHEEHQERTTTASSKDDDRRKEKRKRKAVTWAEDEQAADKLKKKAKIPFETRLEQLREYKEEHGNTRVPQNYPPDQQFSTWVHGMRGKYTDRLYYGRVKALADSKFEALQTLGFEPRGESKKWPWETRFEQLQDYQSTYGDTNVPETWEKDPLFARWTTKQRYKFRQRQQGDTSAMTDERFAKLKSLGFASSSDDVVVEDERKQASWETRFQQLQDYQDVYGDVNVPHVLEEDQQFADWVKEQRVKFSARAQGDTQAISDKRYEALERMGFIDEATEKKKASFDMRLAQMVRFKREFQHTRVPKGYDSVPGLRKWVVKTRKKYRGREQGTESDLTQDQIDQLDEIGFTWDSKHNNTASATENGDTSEENGKVATTTQKRPAVKNGKKPAGADSSAKDGTAGHSVTKTNGHQSGEKGGDNQQNQASDSAKHDAMSEFEARFAQLETFKRQFNHFRVPKNHVPGLRKWIARVRKQFKEKEMGISSDLTDEQIHRLNGLGFVWKKKSEEGTRGENDNSHKNSVGQTNQNEEINREGPTINPRGANGHSDGHAKKNGSSKESASKQSCDMSFTDRIQQLKAVKHGMVPKTCTVADPRAHKIIWTSRFKELEQYESIHGNTRVPSRYEEDQAFADWVWAIRKDFSLRSAGDREALSEDRFKALQKLGFEAYKMNELSPSFEKRLSSLKDFYGVFGHSKVPKSYAAAPGLRGWLTLARSNYKLWEEGDPTVLSLKELEALNTLEFDWLGRKAKFASQKKSSPLNSPGSPGAPTSPTKRKPESPVNGRVVESLAGKPPPPPPPLPSTAARGAVKDSACDTSADAGELPSNGGGKKKVPWADRIAKLKAFKASNGHTRVPSTYPEDQSFANWILQQRVLFSKRLRGDTSAMSDERFEQLERIGLNTATTAGPSAAAITEQSSDNGGVATRKTGTTTITSNVKNNGAAAARKNIVPWADRITKLKAFKESTGHTQVPSVYPEDQGFSNWVIDQRKRFSKRMHGDIGAMSDERFEELHDIGMKASKPRAKSTVSFKDRLEQLKQFRETHGNIRVKSDNHEFDEGFFGWVKSQKSKFAKKKRGEGNMSDERYEELRQVGFE